MDHAPEQLPLQMITYYQGPRLVDPKLLLHVRTYREAVRACWEMRTRKHLTQALLAEEVGLYPSHVSDYLSLRPNKRDLPGASITAFENACGNRLITQWMTHRAGLHLLEEVTAFRRAA